MNVVECKHVTKSFGDLKVINDLSFSIKEDTITGLIGRNGAGKTTLLKMITGLWHETSGDIHVFSKRPFNNLTVSANTIFIDDQMNFPDALTLIEILEQGKRFYQKWDMDFAERLFNYFSFHPKQNHGSLSKGKKSTFNMIFGLASRSPLTIFDEPTTGMDASVRNDFYRVLLRDYLAFPRTIIISSHYLDEIEHLLEDVLLIDQGEKKLHLPIDELQVYAIGLEGNRALLMQWLNGNDDLLYTKYGENEYAYIVIRNTIPKAKLAEAKQLGIEVTAVSPADVCLYVTNKTKRGIDDVLDYS